MILDREHFPLFLNEQGLVGKGVEVGVDVGIYANCLLSRWKGKKLIGIDTWAYAPERLSECVNRNEKFISDGRYEINKLPSVDAASLFSPHSCDFVYIDAIHHELEVEADIQAWVRRIVPGGFLCGHDFCLSNECTVPPAVLRFAYKSKLPIWITPCTSWWIRLPQSQLSTSQELGLTS
jgi:hypothetical protein